MQAPCQLREDGCAASKFPPSSEIRIKGESGAKEKGRPFREVSRFGVQIRERSISRTASRRRHLENDTVVPIRTPAVRRTEEVAFRVRNRTGGICSISAAGKLVENRGCPSAIGGRKLEDQTIPVITATAVCAIEISRCVHRQCAIEKDARRQVVNHRKSPSAIGRRQLVNGGATCAVKIARSVEHQGGLWIASVGSALEKVDGFFCPAQA